MAVPIGRRTSTAASSSSRHDESAPAPNPREENDGADDMEYEDPTQMDLPNFTDGDDNMLSSLRKRYEATEPAALRPTVTMPSLEDKDEVAKEMKESILWRRCLSCLGSLQPSQDDVFSQRLLGSIGYFQTRTIISEI